MASLKINEPPSYEDIRDMPEERLFLDVSELAKCNGKRLAIDVETTGLQWWQDELIGVGIWCPDAGVYGYIPTLSDEDRQEVKAAIPQLLDDPNTLWIAHNLKFDFHFLDMDPFGKRIMDTTVLVHLLDSRYKKSAEQVERVFLGTKTKRELVDAMGTKKRSMIWEWPLEHTARYCMNDVRIEYAFAEVLTPEVVDLGMWKLFQKDMRYIGVLWEIERMGIMLDVEYVNRAHHSLEDRLKALEQELFDGLGQEINWNSPAQLSRALYDDMGWPRPVNPFADADGVDRSRFADRGKYNKNMTSAFILMEKAKHPLGETVANLRETRKMIRDYLESWLNLMDENHILHTNFNITGTRTGRLSSGKPNVQNIPSEVRGRFFSGLYSGDNTRTEEYNLRSALRARPGHIFVATDWSQMEMRMFGILTADPFMLSSLKAGRDVHADIAEACWGSRDSVHREWAKMISFGLIYGMTTGSLQFKLNMTKQQAHQITQQYWDTFPRIQPWLQETVRSCRDLGYVRYWSGRRWVEEDESYMYKGANAMIQGGCADLLSIAALRSREWVEEYDARIINLVHDEIIFEVPEEHAAAVARRSRETMAMPDIFDIEWKTGTKVGYTYGDQHKWDVDAGAYAETEKEDWESKDREPDLDEEAE